jgi:hypothetical protein
MTVLVSNTQLPKHWRIPSGPDDGWKSNSRLEIWRTRGRAPAQLTTIAKGLTSPDEFEATLDDTAE